jgi:CheY-like chemotaxis protein
MKLKEPDFKYNNVMLIDDSELDNFINEKTIEANYFARKLYIHTSARSGIEFLYNLTIMGNKFIEAFPQVIFIDINMPMMDGFQFLEHFRTSGHILPPKTRFVILTSSVNEHDRERSNSYETDITFVNKPLTREMLDTI